MPPLKNKRIVSNECNSSKKEGKESRRSFTSEAQTDQEKLT
jgi:hypothetical protein